MRKRSAEQKQETKNAVIKFLKSLIAPCVFLAVVGALLVYIVKHSAKEDPDYLIPVNAYAGDGKEIVLENDELKFVMDPTTTYFDVTVKSSGKVWSSIPDDVETDTIALSSEKGRIRSTLGITYSDDKGTEVPYNNYNYSIENQTYDVETDGNSITVHYSIGKVAKEYVIPPVCTATDMESYFPLLDTTELNLVKQYYKKYDINNLTKKDNEEELLANYPELANQPLYVIRDSANDSIKGKLQSIFADTIGYTYEKFVEDKALDMSLSANDNPVYNVDVIYRLEGGDLIVEVPFTSIEYPADRPILTLDVLPFFGAGGRDDEGFLFVPEGSGALIDFNNGKTAQSVYYANVYGWDMCHARDAVVHNTSTAFGTFGVSCFDDSFICTIEGGASYAAIEADIAGKFNSYNNVNAQYGIVEREQYDVGSISNSQVYVFQEEIPDETIRQRYTFIDSGSYVDMAKEYQSYLLENYGEYLTKNDDTEAPVVVEIIGAVDKVKQIVGVPVSRPLELTTYDEASDIVNTLYSEGMQNMIVKMTGWCNGGVNQSILKDVDTIHALGSSRALKNLCQTATGLGCDVYLNGITEYAYDSNIFDGFFSYADSARFMSRKLCELHPYSNVTYGERDGLDPHYLLHEQLILEMMDNLNDAVGKYGATGASFQDVGSEVSSDFYRRNPYSREDALNDQVAKLAEIKAANGQIMINTGNVYAAVYSDVITDMELKGSEYTIIDHYVPFYELALHGYVTYTGKPVNNCGAEQDEILLSAEYGAGLIYTVMAEEVEALQKTLYPQYYGSAYNSVHDRMLETYTRYNNELGHVFNQQMTDHRNITEYVSCTEYEDGTRVYVNYGYSDYVADGITIPARDYVVK